MNFGKTSQVHQCRQGHFICGDCKPRVQVNFKTMFPMLSLTFNISGLSHLQGKDDWQSSRVREPSAATGHLTKFYLRAFKLGNLKLGPEINITNYFITRPEGCLQLRKKGLKGFNRNLGLN